MRRKKRLVLAAAVLVVMLVMTACGRGEQSGSPPRSGPAAELLGGERFYLRYTTTELFADQRPTEFVEVKDGSLRLQKYEGDDGEPIVTLTENGISWVYIGGEFVQEIRQPEAAAAPAQLQYTGKTGKLKLEETALSSEEYSCSDNGTDFTLKFLFSGEELWGIEYGEDGRYVRVLELTREIPAEVAALYRPGSDGAVVQRPFEIKNQEDDWRDDWDISGLSDPAPAEQLCAYFLEHLTPDDYVLIECHHELTWGWEPTGETETIDYYISILAEDKEPFQKLLDSYHGPWTPVVFQQESFSLSDLMEAQAEVKAFLEAHPEIVYDDLRIAGDYVAVEWVREGYEQLREFTESYNDSHDVYVFAEKFVPEEMLNPD